MPCQGAEPRGRAKPCCQDSWRGGRAGGAWGRRLCFLPDSSWTLAPTDYRENRREGEQRKRGLGFQTCGWRPCRCWKFPRRVAGARLAVEGCWSTKSMKMRLGVPRGAVPGPLLQLSRLGVMHPLPALPEPLPPNSGLHLLPPQDCSVCGDGEVGSGAGLSHLWVLAGRHSACGAGNNSACPHSEKAHGRFGGFLACNLEIMATS